MSVRIVYKDIAPGADTDAAVTATGHDTAVSDVSLLPFGSGNPKKYATLEHNLWTLDGSWSIYDGGDVSLWSAELSDGSGWFATAPVITISFDNRYTSLGISFDFGGDCWCDDMNIVWYQGTTQLSAMDFAPDSSTYFCENTVTAYDKLVVTMRGTSLPRRRLRLDAISFGIIRTFNRDELRRVSLIQEIDPTSRELVANSLDWKLSSKAVVEYIFQFKQPVYAYDGDTLIGVGYITDSDQLGKTLYDIICTDAIGVLDNDPWPDAYYSNVNAYTLVQQICSGFTVEMQEDLKSVTLSGILKGKTRRGALQQVCFALGAVADTSGTDTIQIFTLSADEAKEIEADRTRTGGSVKHGDMVTSVRLTAHSYSTTGSQNEVEINGVKYYDTRTVTVINNPDATASDKPKVEEITDATLVSPSNVAAVAQHLYDHYARRDTHKFKLRLEGEKPGEYVTTTTPWGDTLTGHYLKGSIVLSGIAVSDAEVIGE